MPAPVYAPDTAPPAPAPFPAPAPAPAVAPAPASKCPLPLSISTSEPGAIEDHDHNLTNPRHACTFQLLQAKHKLVSHVDAIFQKHIDGVREQQKHWRLALDTFMFEAEDTFKAPLAATAKVRRTTATNEGRETSLPYVSEEPADLADTVSLNANGRKQREDVLQKSQEAVDCLDSGCGALSTSLDDMQTHDRDVRKTASVVSNSWHPETSRQSRGSKTESILSKASSHHTRKQQSALGFSEWKKKKSGSSFPSYERRTWRTELEKVVHSTPFDGCVFCVIFANVLFVGIEVDFIATHPRIAVPHLFVVANHCFAAIFTLELTIRLIALGCSFLSIDNKDWAWNWFDVVVVMSSLVEIAADVVSTSSSNMDMVHFRVIRIIRVTRLLRTLRMVRMVRFIRALRTLLHSIISTLRAAIWSLLLLLIIFYGFGVGLTQAVMDYCDTLPIAEDNAFTVLQVRAANCEDKALMEFWGTLPRSMFTLFKSVAGGISWHVVVQPLSEAGFLWVMFFVGFITFTALAVLNVVTGLFCQSAIESAKQDKDIATMQSMAIRAYHTQALEQLFAEMDVEHTGNLTIHEFEQSLGNSRIKAFLESLDLCCNDAWALFQLLDVDDSGSIDKGEFLEGCLQLRGNASAVSLAKMAYDNKLVHNMLEELVEFMEENMLSLRHGSPIRPSDALATGQWEYASECVSSHDSSWIRKEPVNGFERQLSSRRAPLSFCRQSTPKQRTSRNASKERPSHHN